MKNRLSVPLTLALLSTLNAGLSTLQAQGTAFTYQGRLDEAASPAHGSYDLQFALHDAASGGTQKGGTWTQLAIAVSNGLFTVSLDFGNQFPGADRWLEIGVRTNGGGVFSLLSPRQPITATPYAIKAREAATVPAGTITGAMLADGAVNSSKLQAGAALQNILASGSASVTPGGVVMSDDPANSALTVQGYVRMPNAEMTLAAEKWTQLNPPAASAEFIPGRWRELSVSTGNELIVFRFDFIGMHDAMRLVETIRYSLTTGQWSKATDPPQGVVVGGGATAVWTGSQVILWRGEEFIASGLGSEFGNPTRVLMYSPASNQWTVIAGTGAIPEGRRVHAAVWTGSRMLIWGGEKLVDVLLAFSHYYVREDLNTGASFDPATGVWTAISTNAAPGKRRGHAAVWTGSRMLVQGGTQNNRPLNVDDYRVDLYSTNVFNNGASYNPANDTWSLIRSDSSAPRLAFAQAVWTGSEMFTFGGVKVVTVTVYLPPEEYGPGQQYALTLWAPERPANSYHPTNDFWTFRGIPDGSGPNIMGRMNGTLAWTGSEVIAWGGEGLDTTYYEPFLRADGQAYNMSNGTWRTLPAAPSALTGGANPQSAWLSNQLIVCDPPSFTGILHDAVNPARAAYSPLVDSWNVLPDYFGAAPLKQDDPSAVWTGQEFIIWGGPVNGVVSNRGRRYNPTTGLWTEISTTNAPSARMRHSAVWIGSRVIVWGGDGGGDPLYPAVVHSTGGAYAPVTDTWTTLPAAPFDPLVQDVFHRTGHKAVWTIYGMIVVGGSDGYNGQGTIFPKTIARLSPNLDEWTLSSNT